MNYKEFFKLSKKDKNFYRVSTHIHEDYTEHRADISVRHKVDIDFKQLMDTKEAQATFEYQPLSFMNGFNRVISLPVKLLEDDEQAIAFIRYNNNKQKDAHTLDPNIDIKECEIFVNMNKIKTESLLQSILVHEFGHAILGHYHTFLDDFKYNLYNLIQNKLKYILKETESDSRIDLDDKETRHNITNMYLPYIRNVVLDIDVNSTLLSAMEYISLDIHLHDDERWEEMVKEDLPYALNHIDAIDGTTPYKHIQNARKVIKDAKRFLFPIKFDENASGSGSSGSGVPIRLKDGEMQETQTSSQGNMMEDLNNQEQKVSKEDIENKDKEKNVNRNQDGTVDEKDIDDNLNGNPYSYDDYNTTDNNDDNKNNSGISDDVLKALEKLENAPENNVGRSDKDSPVEYKVSKSTDIYPNLFKNLDILFKRSFEFKHKAYRDVVYNFNRAKGDMRVMMPSIRHKRIISREKNKVDNIHFLVDVSSSMDGNVIKRIIGTIDHIFLSSGRNMNINIITWNTQLVQTLTKDNIKQKDIAIGGCTALDSGIKHIVNKYMTSDENILIVISDMNDNLKAWNREAAKCSFLRKDHFIGIDVDSNTSQYKEVLSNFTLFDLDDTRK